jgi:hypothetical protein
MDTHNFVVQKKIKRQETIPRILQNNMCCIYGKISLFNGLMLKFTFLSEENQEIGQLVLPVA